MRAGLLQRVLAIGIFTALVFAPLAARATEAQQ